MTPATLRSCTYKDLAELAKKHGVQGWHSMRKDQLVRVLSRKVKPKVVARPVRLAPAPLSKSNGPKVNGLKSVVKATPVKSVATKTLATKTMAPKTLVAKKPTDPRVQRQIMDMRGKLERAKNIGVETSEASKNGLRDRLVVMVRGPYWLHVYWELSYQSVARVQAAMDRQWHTAKPVLRLFVVSDSSATAAAPSDMLQRTIEIHGGVNNWYVDIQDPPKSYRMEIGYLATDGRFFSITRSNVVTTPAAASRDTLDENWVDVAENLDRIYAMSGGYSPEGTSQELKDLLEERLRRPMGTTLMHQFSQNGGAPLDNGQSSEFHFDADAEMIIYGTTRPDARVTLTGEPVPLRPDGSFTVRLNMPDRRQVIPVVACSPDGTEQRTIVLAVERNTKRMEKVSRDALS